MELGSDEGSSMPRCRGANKERSAGRRMWTILEEECLVAALRNLVVTVGSICQGDETKGMAIFPAWSEIFGRDRATEERSTDPFKEATDVRNEEIAEIAVKRTGGSLSRKRTASEVDDGFPKLVQMVTNFCESADARLGILTRVLENEFGDPEHRSLILQQVREQEGFDENEQLIVANKLVKDPKEMELFQGLIRDSRLKFVRLMLASKI
ncbi:UNVERIFIED_CONTAM: hypothetical protein Sindi_0712700 [Sesamum indicum]